MDVKEYLARNGIKFKSFLHPPVYTCEEAEQHNKGIRGIHSKNLFLKDKKSRRFYLVILPAHEKVDITRLEGITGDRLKFANENDLKEVLGLGTGAVSPFGLINDKESKGKLLIKKDVWDSDFVSFHPNVNIETLEIPGGDFHRFVKSLKNSFMII
jgi:Ala-tRNA(Pro) deacylase